MVASTPGAGVIFVPATWPITAVFVYSVIGLIPSASLVNGFTSARFVKSLFGPGLTYRLVELFNDFVYLIVSGIYFMSYNWYCRAGIAVWCRSFNSAGVGALLISLCIRFAPSLLFIFAMALPA